MNPCLNVDQKRVKVGTWRAICAQFEKDASEVVWLL